MTTTPARCLIAVAPYLFVLMWATGFAVARLSAPLVVTRKLVRHERAQIAVEADATDPATTGPAIGAVAQAVSQTLSRELSGPLASYRPGASPVDVVLHRRYNPEGVTRFNIVPRT